MRSPVGSVASVFVIFSISAAAGAQHSDRLGAEGEIVAYHTHRDARFGHDHSYPDRGAIIRDLPKGAAVVSYAGISYRFQDGVWFEPRGPAFMAVAPPIGLIVPSLPQFSTVLARGGKTFLYGNDTFYLPRPDVGGYEVVNDPDDASTGAASTYAPPSPSWDGSSLKAMEAAAPAATAITASATTAGTPLSTAPAVSNGGIVTAAAMPAAENATEAVADPAKASKAAIYPKNGQNADQQARDRYECYQFGVTQSGFDPMHAATGSSTAGLGTAAKANGAADFERAQGVCLDAHGYTVR